MSYTKFIKVAVNNQDVVDKLYKNKAGKTPQRTAESVGQWTSSALLLATAAAAGAAIGRATYPFSGYKGGIYGGLTVGLGASALAKLIEGSLEGKGKRTPEEQQAYNEGSTLGNYLIPGMAIGNMRRSKATFEDEYMKQPGATKKKLENAVFGEYGLV